MATYPVKYVNNAMRGAPVLNGTAGSLISVLDAFLVTGFGLTTAQSVTVSGGIATATVQAGNSFDKDCIVLVDGATPAALNGEQRVLTASSTAITWATTAPDGPATGTITIKVAPVGWQKLYSGTNKAVYRSTDPQASGFCLRVDDTGTTAARVRGFESMTDVDTGSGPFPTDAQISGGGYWHKSMGASNVSAYQLVADSRALVFAVSFQYGTYGVRCFGDMVALAPNGDVFSAAINCSDSGDLPSAYRGDIFSRTGWVDTTFLARPLSGQGAAMFTQIRSYVGKHDEWSGADGTLGVFPSAVDGQLKFSARFLTASAAADVAPRANLPGVYSIPQSGVIAHIGSGAMLAGSGALAGRRLLALGGNYDYRYGSDSIALIDITGPWR